MKRLRKPLLPATLKCWACSWESKFIFSNSNFLSSTLVAKFKCYAIKLSFTHPSIYAHRPTSTSNELRKKLFCESSLTVKNFVFNIWTIFSCHTGWLENNWWKFRESNFSHRNWCFHERRCTFHWHSQGENWDFLWADKLLWNLLIDFLVDFAMFGEHVWVELCVRRW